MAHGFRDCSPCSLDSVVSCTVGYNMVAGHGGGVAGESCAHGSQKVEQEGRLSRHLFSMTSFPQTGFTFGFYHCPASPLNDGSIKVLTVQTPS